MDVRIEATAVEPEYVHVTDIGGGCLRIEFELARIGITDQGSSENYTGKIAMNFMAADVSTLMEKIGTIVFDQITGELNQPYRRG